MSYDMKIRSSTKSVPEAPKMNYYKVLDVSTDASRDEIKKGIS